MNASLRFDMRAPEISPASAADLYAAALDMAQWADDLGFAAVGLSEHHGAEDGYLPSPLTMAGMVVGRTRRVRIMIGALLVPLYDATQLAEDLAVLDLASGGRVAVVAGLGYRPEEYALRGVNWKERGKLLDRSLRIMLDAWSGKSIEKQGYSLRVTPRPASRPHPFLAIGGSSVHAARRAVEFGLPFAPAGDDEELNRYFEQEWRKRNETKPPLVKLTAPATFISNDPEKSWRELGKYFLHDAMTYASWQPTALGNFWHSKARTVEDLKADGRYRIWSPERCLEEAGRSGGLKGVHFSPLLGGAPPELGWESLRLFEDKVLPHLR